MAVRKICRPRGCRGSARCEHAWWFDVMYAGKRWRMRVDEFALVRGATERHVEGRPQNLYGSPGEFVAAATDGHRNRLLTAFEVADYIGCHEETVRRAYSRGLLASQRCGVRGRRFSPGGRA